MSGKRRGGWLRWATGTSSPLSKSPARERGRSVTFAELPTLVTDPVQSSAVETLMEEVNGNGGHDVPPTRKRKLRRGSLSGVMMDVGAVGDLKEEPLPWYHVANQIESEHLGDKTIGTWGSAMLMVNNITGPGILVLPYLFKEAGSLVPCCVFLIIMAISTLSCVCMCEAMARMPGNSNFERRAEFSTIFQYYFGPRVAAGAQLMLCLCLTALNCASVIAQAQVTDELVVLMFGKTWALQLTSSDLGPAFSFVADSHGFANGAIPGPCLTVGYIASMFLVMPMGLCNLDENIIVQVIAFWGMVLGCFEFIWWFLWGKPMETGVSISPSDVPLFGHKFGSVLGVVMFNYAATVTVPSWLNEKAPHVSVGHVMVQSNFWSTVLYIAIGLIGAWAYPTDCPSNVLTELSSPGADPAAAARVVTRITAMVWSFFMIGSSIPVYSIMVRYNLLVSGICGGRWSQFWGTAFPWLISWVFYVGKAFDHFVNWTSLLVFGLINFIGPLVD